MSQQVSRRDRAARPERPELDPEVLSPLALSILELLDEHPMHPYEMASKMRLRHHDEFIRLNFGTLYHTVDVLERSGWIVPVEK
jgi:DNA-binding PadR family transcriptional regulator